MIFAILAFFIGLIIYRAACHHMGWPPFPVVQITINNQTVTDA